jgi:glucokinase
MSGLRARVCEALAAGRASMLATAGDTLSVEGIAAAAQAGDALAGEVLARAATYLGLAVANVVDSWDPELVVLSGPVIAAGDALFKDLLATEQRSVLETGRNQVRVGRAAIQAHAKIIGAATLVIVDYLAAPLLAR